MKLAIFLDQLRFGGAERALTRVANGFAERGYDVDLLTRNLGHAAYLDSLNEKVRLRSLGKVPKAQLLAFLMRHNILNVRGLVRHGVKLSMSMRTVPILVKYLKVEKPDALLTTLPDNNITALWARHIANERTRVVIREANLISKHFKRSTSLPLGFVSYWYNQADAIISVSGGVGDDLSATLSIPRSRIRTIYNPIDLAEISARAAGPIGHPWLTQRPCSVLICIGRLTEQKDHSTLLRAFAQANRSKLMRMLIVGDGKLKADLEQEAELLGIRSRIDFLGHVANPFPLIANSDLLVLPSLWEGLPNVLIEALACGTPVVATDCEGGGAREILINGKLGHLVSPSEPEALAAAIVGALEKDGQPSSETSLALNRFEKEAILNKYLEAMSDRSSNAEHQ